MPDDFSEPGMARKMPTGIDGFDRMARGGLPRGRITAVIGSAGAGKTVLALQSMVHAVRCGGAGVFVSFEQSPQSIREGLQSFDWATQGLPDSERIQVIDGRLKSSVVLSGSFDLGGLLAMVQGAFSSYARNASSCIVLDGIDALLAVLASASAQRSELLRLQEFAESMPATIILTLKALPNAPGGLEEMALYMADCVVDLERHAEEGMATRSLRIQKYRNCAHAQSRVPFIVSRKGIEIAVIEPEPHQTPVTGERLSVGVGRLDTMLGGGLFRASSTLISGAPGTAKTTLGTCFLESVCQNGERALGVFFDENPAEIVRNVASVAIDLSRHVASGLLVLHGMVDRSASPDEFAHEIAEQVRLHRPAHVLIDPASIFTGSLGAQNAVRRLIQLCKREGITVVMTSLLERSATESESSRSYVSTLCDNWIHLSYVLQAGERNRALTIVKSRGTAHSNQVGELMLSHGGITIADVYVEDGAVLMGTMRWQKERANDEAIRATRDEVARSEREIVRSIRDLEQRRTEIGAELEDRRDDLLQLQHHGLHARQSEDERRVAMRQRRGAWPLAGTLPEGEQ